jgi:membrane-associated HD superfamily phosphohydrolase
VRGVGSKRTKKRKPSSEHITFQIPPLISKTQWDLIQKQTEFNKIKSKRSDNTEDLILRDVLICERCGGRVKPRVGNVRKDGTAPRYYVCYWAGTSKKNLIASGRKKKCSLPFIRTKSIESRVWVHFMMGFVFSPSKILEYLYNPKKHKDKINQLKETIDRLEIEITKKDRARNKLYMLLEEDETNLGELKDRLRINKDEILTLKGNLNDTQSEYQKLVSISENEEDISNFLRNNKNLLRKLRKDISNLNLKDRKLLIESSLMDKVTVNYQEDNEIDGPGGPTCEFKINSNLDTLQRFMEEGKITNLDKNSTHNPARYDI